MRWTVLDHYCFTTSSPAHVLLSANCITRCGTCALSTCAKSHRCTFLRSTYPSLACCGLGWRYGPWLDRAKTSPLRRLATPTKLRCCRETGTVERQNLRINRVPLRLSVSAGIGTPQVSGLAAPNSEVTQSYFKMRNHCLWSLTQRTDTEPCTTEGVGGWDVQKDSVVFTVRKTFETEPGP